MKHIYEVGEKVYIVRRSRDVADPKQVTLWVDELQIISCDEKTACLARPVGYHLGVCFELVCNLYLEMKDAWNARDHLAIYLHRKEGLEVRVMRGIGANGSNDEGEE